MDQREYEHWSRVAKHVNRKRGTNFSPLEAKAIFDSAMNNPRPTNCSKCWEMPFLGTTEARGADMRVEIDDVQRTILHEIEAGATQRQVAQTYALALRSSVEIDWRAVNAMIALHWSESGLERIKRMAHSGSCFSE